MSKLKISDFTAYINRVSVFLGLLIAISSVFGARVSLAAEGAASNYFPGGYGDYAVATAPSPGFIYVNYNLFLDASVDRTVLQGRVNADFNTSAYVNMSALIYAFEEPVFGGQFTMAGFVPIGYADLDAQIISPIGSMSVNDSETALGDISIMPASFYWNKDNWHFNLYELIVTPTGQYDINNNINLGRNYWSFDTVFAVTNLNKETGREFSMVTGFIINTENEDTDYETGSELHIDMMFNQFLSDNLAIGLHGYYYEQLEGDSGSGAVLGDFKGDSYGIGPSFLWIPKSGGGKFSVTGSWLHDLDATQRIESDYAVVTLAWQFGGTK